MGSAGSAFPFVNSKTLFDRLRYTEEEQILT